MTLASMLGALARSHVDKVKGSVGTEGGDRREESEIAPDWVTIDDSVGIYLLKFAEVVAAGLAAGAPENRVTGARRGA
jgi:hypothetical protein